MSRIWWLVALAICSFTTDTAQANADVEKSRAAFTAGVAAAKVADNTRAASLLRSALALRATHAGLMLRLAAVLVANGELDEAAALIKRAAAFGQATTIAGQPAFKALQNHPLFLDALGRAKQNLLPIGSGQTVVTGLPPGQIPEGIAGHHGTTYVSSVATGRIFKFGRNIAATPLPTEHLFGAFGLAIDTTRNALWVATSQMPQHEPSRRAKALTQAGIARIDLGSGETAALYLAANDGLEHNLGDVALAPGGDVYATDSKAPHIYRIAAAAIGPAAAKAAPKLERWLSSAEFSSLQGLVFSADGRHAYVADYAVGLARIEVATKRIDWLRAPPETTLLGIDGLYRNGCDLIATQNGVEPNRVLRIALTPAGDGIRAVDVVAANLPGLTDLTHGTLVDEQTLRVIARSDWHALKPDDTLPNMLEAPVVMDIRLPAQRCK